MHIQSHRAQASKSRQLKKHNGKGRICQTTKWIKKDERNTALAGKERWTEREIHIKCCKWKTPGKNKSDNHKIIIKKHFICDVLIWLYLCVLHGKCELDQLIRTANKQRPNIPFNLFFKRVRKRKQRDRLSVWLYQSVNLTNRICFTQS